VYCRDASAGEVPAVLKVHASLAHSRNGVAVRHLTGFVVDGQDGIVTALHGVLNADELTADGVNSAGKPFALTNLSIMLVDIAHDLAVLRVPPGQVAMLALIGKLSESESVPTDRDTVQVVGYPRGVDAQLDQRFVRVDKLTKLSQLFPAEMPRNLRRAFRLRGSPDPSESVIALEAMLQPGQSGAPLLDGKRQVVGVVLGGLPGTAIGFATAWQSRVLRPVAAVAPQIADLERLDDEVFSYAVNGNQEDDSRPSAVTAGGFGDWVEGGAGRYALGGFMGYKVNRRILLAAELKHMVLPQSREIATLPGAPPARVELEASGWYAGVYARYGVWTHLFERPIDLTMSTAVGNPLGLQVGLGLIASPDAKLALGLEGRVSRQRWQTLHDAEFNPYGNAFVAEETNSQTLFSLEFRLEYDLWR
jgi:hypothetical protein